MKPDALRYPPGRRSFLQFGTVAFGTSLFNSGIGPFGKPPDEKSRIPGSEESREESISMILRHYIRPEYLNEDCDFLITFCRQTGCRTLLLFTSSYEFDPSVIPVGQIAAYMESLKPFKARAAEEDIKIYLNVLQTLGHVYLPEETRKQYGIERRIGINGKGGDGGCPLCPNLRAYLKDVYQIYAQFGSDLIFVDDDYRYLMQGDICCFCGLHLAALGSRLGQPVTREEVKRSILSADFTPDDIKREYWQVLNDAMVDLAREIEGVVHGIDPDCRLGVMTASMPHGSFGTDIRQVAKAFAGGRHRPFIRPQTGMYSEVAGKSTAARLLHPAIARDLLGDDIDYFPEIENYTYSLFSKSAHVTFLQMLVQYFYGFKNLALNFYFTCDTLPRNPLDDPFMLMLEKSGIVFEIVSRHAGRNPVIEGAYIVDDLQRPYFSRGLVMGTSPLYTCLLNMGIPIGFQADSHFQVLTGDAVLAKTDEELSAIMKRGSLIDSRALECLEHRGCAVEIGVIPGDILPMDETGAEFFADAEFNPQFHGTYFPLHAKAGAGDFRILDVANPRARVISRIVDYKRKAVTPGIVLVETDSGVRHAVLAHALPDERFFQSMHRQEQLIHIFEWIAQEELPVKILNAPYMVPYLIRNQSTGRRYLLLINFSSDTYRFILIGGSVLAGLKKSEIAEIVPRSQESPGYVALNPLNGKSVLAIEKEFHPFDYLLLKLG